MTVRQCDACGHLYTAQRATSRFCSSTCRARVARGQVPNPQTSTRVAGDITEAVRRELQAVDREATPLGQTAISLAMALDGVQAGASGIAALARELRATMTDAMAGATTGRTPLDDLRERYNRRRFYTPTGA